MQAIVVNKDLTHEEAIWGGAYASFYPYDDGPHTEWLNSGMRKTVRRATEKQIETLHTDHSDILYGTALNSVLVSKPMQYKDFPKKLSKLQVSGTDFTQEGNTGIVPAKYTIFVLDTLTTGKAVAQAAHAVWLGGLSSDKLAASMKHGNFEIMLVDDDELFAMANSDYVEAVVHDAGHTEVDSGTLTAVMISN